MLLDDFMQGFLFELVRQKWQQYTRYVFYAIRFIEIGYLGALTALSFQLKQYPGERWSILALFTLVVGLALASLEVALMVLWWRNDSIRGFDSLAGMGTKLAGLDLWARAFSWRTKMVAFANATVACAYYLLTVDEEHSSRSDAPLYLLFGMSSYMQGKGIIQAICVSPSMPQTGVQMIVINKMFSSDVSKYLAFLTAFILNYYLALYITLPTNADDGEHDLLNGRYVRFDMAHPLTGLNAMFESAIVGLRFAPNFEAEMTDDFTPVMWLCFLCFYAVHLSFVIVCIILLVRLLMAMMTNTFRKVQEQAQLEWRLLITRHVLRLEVLGDLLLRSSQTHRLFAGELHAGEYVHNFLDVRPPAGEPKTIPMQLAQKGDHEPLFDETPAAASQPPKGARSPSGFLAATTGGKAESNGEGVDGDGGKRTSRAASSDDVLATRQEATGDERLHLLVTEMATMHASMRELTEEVAAMHARLMRHDSGPPTPYHAVTTTTSKERRDFSA